MQDRTKTKKGIFYLVFCLSATLCAAAANFFLLKNYSDITNVDGVHQALLFKQGAPTTAFVAFLFFSAAVMLSALVAYRKHDVVKREKTGPVMIFLCSSAGLTLIAAIVMQFVLKTDGTPYAFNDKAASLQNASTMQTVALCCAAPAAVYFFIKAFTDRKTRALHAISVICGLCLVFFCAAELLVVHNYMSDFLRSPARVFAICAYCAVIFFTLSQIRLTLDNRAIPAAFVATGMLAFFVTVTDSLPTLILSFMKAPGFSVGVGSFYTLMKFVVGIYALISVLPTLLYGARRSDVPDRFVPDKQPPTGAQDGGRPASDTPDVPEAPEKDPEPEENQEPAEEPKKTAEDVSLTEPSEARNETGTKEGAEYAEQ